VATIDELLSNNAAYAREMKHGDLASAPSKKLAIVACMDARIDVHRILGLDPGDAHVIRNAGGVVTEDVLRSLVVSQHALGTREVVVIVHTECGMLRLDEDALKARIEQAAGAKPEFRLGAFSDLEKTLINSVERIESSPFLRADTVRGFVYDVRTGRLNEPGTA
jgi:carbonic anhydrase